MMTMTITPTKALLVPVLLVGVLACVPEPQPLTKKGPEEQELLRLTTGPGFPFLLRGMDPNEALGLAARELDNAAYVQMPSPDHQLILLVFDPQTGWSHMWDEVIVLAFEPSGMVWARKLITIGRK